MTTLELEFENLKKELDNQKTINLQQKQERALLLSLAGRQYPNKELPPEVNVLTALAILKSDMEKEGLHVVFDEAGNPQFKQRKDGVDVDYFVDNKKVQLNSYIDATLSANKFIAAGSSNKEVNNVVLQLVNQRLPANHIGVNQTGFGMNSGKISNPAIVAELAQQLSELGF